MTWVELAAAIWAIGKIIQMGVVAALLLLFAVACLGRRY